MLMERFDRFPQAEFQILFDFFINLNPWCRWGYWKNPTQKEFKRNVIMNLFYRAEIIFYWIRQGIVHISIT